MKPADVLKIMFAMLVTTGIPAFVCQTALADPTAIKGDGSTFAYPMYEKWIEEYQKENPDIRISYQSNGSGAGIHDIMLALVDFAGTDGPLTNTQMLDFSTHRNCEVLHYPTALGADVPVYNIAGVQRLEFTPEALAGIYLGNITFWDDPALAKANPGITLPHNQIQVVHRQDGSGTTYVWTDYLSKVSQSWRDRAGTGISVNWPVGIAGKGNDGVAQLVAKTSNSIGYVELTYAVRKQLSYGAVQNRSGNFIVADLASVTAAAAGAAQKMPDDFRVSITDPPGEKDYPISSFTWMLVPSDVPDSAKRAAILSFLQWGLAKGQDLLEPLNYARLPDSVIAQENKALSRIR